jgi:hypothetical protein
MLGVRRLLMVEHDICSNPAAGFTPRICAMGCIPDTESLLRTRLEGDDLHLVRRPQVLRDG